MLAAPPCRSSLPPRRGESWRRSLGTISPREVPWAYVRPRLVLAKDISGTSIGATTRPGLPFSASPSGLEQPRQRR